MLGQLSGSDRVIVADFEAGIGTVLRLTEPVDAVVVVVEPTATSLDVGRRAADVVRERGLGRLVVTANRVRDEADRQRVRAAFPDAEPVLVPDEPAIVAAERRGTAPLDEDPDAPGVRALVALAHRVLAEAGH